MSELAETFDHASEMVDSQEVVPVPGVDLRDLMVQISRLVGHELGRLEGLGEDPEENEEKLRSVIVSAALKAFYSGVSMGLEAASPDGIVVEIPADQLEAIGLQAIRDGVLSVVLTTPAESPQD